LPNAKVLEEKKQIVADLAEKMKSASAGVLVDYKGITVADDTKLRRELREAGVEYSVVKNTLTRFAAHEVGFEGLDPILNGTTALAVSMNDPIAPARILAKYAKDSKTFAIKAGFMDGKLMSVEEVESLAKIPSKEILLANLCSVLLGNVRGLVVALNAIVEKQQEEQSA